MSKGAAKPRRKHSTRTSTKVTPKARLRVSHNAGKKKTMTKAQHSREATTAEAAAENGRATAEGKVGIRVRMYRIGFGDFFLLTVPGNGGPAHILIDCGVHAANIDTINACVTDLMNVTNKRLALVILTHYHADHMSGFASNYDDLADFDHVGAVWITNRLDPEDEDAVKFMAQLTSVANELQLRLGARDDPDAKEARDKAFNAVGGGGSNAKALKLLREGFKNKPPVYYYQGGDIPKLPPELEGSLAAEILAPAPKDSGGEFAASDNRKEQYLAMAGDNGIAHADSAHSFEPDWRATAADYPDHSFDEFDSGLVEKGGTRKNDGAAAMETMLQRMQPDVLAAAADKLDGTLNNQSLVVLFTCQGKKLLFVGDAQWGNWSYWLYGRAVSGADPGVTERARDILGSIDFYKVGHHGSTNATPIPAVGALNHSCAAMCSTARGAYGSVEKKTEVPRIDLIEALETKTGDRLVRSDWVPAGQEPPNEEAKQQLSDLPAGFTTPGQLYIDYEL